MWGIARRSCFPRCLQRRTPLAKALLLNKVTIRSAAAQPHRSFFQTHQARMRNLTVAPGVRGVRAIRRFTTRNSVTLAPFQTRTMARATLPRVLAKAMSLLNSLQHQGHSVLAAFHTLLRMTGNKDAGDGKKASSEKGLGDYLPKNHQDGKDNDEKDAKETEEGDAPDQRKDTEAKKPKASRTGEEPDDSLLDEAHRIWNTLLKSRMFLRVFDQAPLSTRYSTTQPQGRQQRRRCFGGWPKEEAEAIRQRRV